MKTLLVSVLLVGSVCANADGYNPYNQQQTYNYNTGCSNWQSCFGPGINTAAVTLVGGLVNAMSRPEPQVVYQNPQPQVVQGQVYPQQAQYQGGGYPQQNQYQGGGYPQQNQYQGGGYPYGYQAAPPNPYGQQPYYNR